jgi:hypothetical protein
MQTLPMGDQWQHFAAISACGFVISLGFWHLWAQQFLLWAQQFLLQIVSTVDGWLYETDPRPHPTRNSPNPLDNYVGFKCLNILMLVFICLNEYSFERAILHLASSVWGVGLWHP